MPMKMKLAKIVLIAATLRTNLFKLVLYKISSKTTIMWEMLNNRIWPRRSKKFSGILMDIMEKIIMAITGLQVIFIGESSFEVNQMIMDPSNFPHRKY